MTQTQTEQLWTAKQVAKFINVSTSWIAREVRRGKLKAIAIGGTKRKVYRFDPAYIRSRFNGNGTE